MNILYLYAYLPYPGVASGGAQWAFEFIKYFQSHGNLIILANLMNQDEIPHKKKILPYLHHHLTYIPQKQQFSLSVLYNELRKFVSIKPLVIQNHFFRPFYQKISHYLSQNPVDLIFCDNFRMAGYVESLKKDFPKIPVIFRDDEIVFFTKHRNFSYFLQEFFRDLLNRNYLIQNFIRTIEETQLFRLSNYEKKICSLADKILCVSRFEKNLLNKKYPDCKDKIHFITHGISSSEIDYTNQKRDELPDLVFIGNFSHFPNQDAVIYFSTDIFPFIEKSIPNVKVYIIGKNAEILFADIGKKYINFQFPGFIPNLQEIYSKDLIFICPIRLGGGLRTKLLEVMGHEIPVVANTIAAEGFIGLVKKDHDIKIEDNPKCFANSVVQLINSKSLRQEIGANGRKFVVKHYLWTDIFIKLQALFNDLVEMFDPTISKTM
jgi:glycosyltransferase involved in cell wall biosynthesis